ncbi:MAG TPA: HD domain-containing protein [Methanocorpusculum sp.]|nr:HD domain-containing protein [Methanocorpusculum sp.]
MDYIQTLFSRGCDAGVVSHCKKVAEAAARYHGASVDDDLVYAGAVMHDIGRSVTHSIRHAAEGALICTKMGLSDDLVHIVRSHTGAGLSAEEASLLGLLPEDAVPETLEAKIVAHADNLVKGSREITMCERMMLIADLPARSKKNIARLAFEVELLRE